MPTNVADMVKVFERPKSLTEARFTYCPGCHHGIITRIIGQALSGPSEVSEITVRLQRLQLLVQRVWVLSAAQRFELLLNHRSPLTVL